MTATKTKKQAQANKRLLLEQIELNEGQLNRIRKTPINSRTKKLTPNNTRKQSK